MKNCRWFKDVEALVDGEARNAQAVESHVSDCPVCAAHRSGLLEWRAALAPALSAPVLSDQQFPAFMEGIRAGIQEPRTRSGGIWALLSLAAAALVIAVATFSMFSNPASVRVNANEVESVSTDIEGATVGVENGENSVTTIWISIGEDDV
jgi:anti-sigma factor RsiW